MKKLLIALSLVFGTVCLYAANSDNVHHHFIASNKIDVSAKSFSKGKILITPKIKKEFTCTVTVTGSLGPSYANISVSCQATAADCASASSQAVGCIKSTIAAVKKML